MDEKNVTEENEDYSRSGVMRTYSLYRGGLDITVVI